MTHECNYNNKRVHETKFTILSAAIFYLSADKKDNTSKNAIIVYKLSMKPILSCENYENF